MRQGIPTSYWLFRWAWSALHAAILVALLAAFLIWALTDQQGAKALSGWFNWIEQLRRLLSSLIPYPWS